MQHNLPKHKHFYHTQLLLGDSILESENTHITIKIVTGNSVQIDSFTVGIKQQYQLFTHPARSFCNILLGLALIKSNQGGIEWDTEQNNISEDCMTVESVTPFPVSIKQENLPGKFWWGQTKLLPKPYGLTCAGLIGNWQVWVFQTVECPLSINE